MCAWTLISRLQEGISRRLIDDLFSLLTPLRAPSAVSRAHEALGLAFGPGESLLHRLALHVADGHLGHQTLRVNLHGDFRWRRSGSD